MSQPVRIEDAEPSDLLPPQEWMTAEEASAFLGKTVRTLVRLTSAGHLRTKSEPVPGRKDRTVYHTGDLYRLRTEGAPAKEAADNLPAELPRPGLPKLAAAAGGAPVRVHIETGQLLEKIAERLLTAPAPEPEKPLWIPIEEAVRLLGLEAKTIRKLIRDGHLEAINEAPSGKAQIWKIRRESLRDLKPPFCAYAHNRSRLPEPEDTPEVVESE